MNPPVVVAALYKFAPIKSPESTRERLLSCCTENGIGGTLLVATEGLNGTIAGSREGIDALLTCIRALPGFEDLEHKESYTDSIPFLRMKVKVKPEIVTFGQPGVDPNKKVGAYVDPKDWNALIQDPDVVVIDTRNDFEVDIGTFEGAINPHTTSFREFPQFVKNNLNPETTPKVAMFCTGGIRCEKATGWMMDQGFKEVYHLRGGILKYLEEIPEKESTWNGECFVFDNRITVDSDLKPGNYEQCHACKHPVSREETQRPEYSPGVSCPYCHGSLTEEQRKRAASRQRQMELARERETRHLGTL